MVRLASAAAALAAIGLLPMLLGALWLKILISAIIYMLPAAGLALLHARLGLVSLAQVALVGVGGWVTLRLWHASGLPFEIDMLAGGIAAALTGMLIGLPALRMRGLYFALISLMAAAGFQIFITATQFPNGGPGWLGQIVTGLLFRAFPALLNDIGVNGDLAYVIFGVALLHALITAPTGIAGQVAGGVSRLTRRRP
jgi:branched-chain amino acid transport system permease protein